MQLDKLKQYADIFGRGLMKEMLPEIAGGMLVQLFHKWRVDVPKVCQYVEQDKSLLDVMGDDDKEKLKKIAGRVGKLDWVSTELALNALQDDFPAVVSLFLGWDEAYNWLERQLQEIKDFASMP